MKMIRALLDSVDGRVEDALAAHGFSFSALAADDKGAAMEFHNAENEGQGESWSLSLRLPPAGPAELALRRGAEAEPAIALALRVGAPPIASLGDALAIAMTLFAAIEQG